MNQYECKAYLLKVLRELVVHDYILLDLPYFPNIGDILIWYVAQELLKEIPYKCKYAASIETYEKKRISENTIIIFMGGGNYGDLWERHQIFRRKVMSDYPNNPVLQLPQSVCFLSAKKQQQDIEFMCSHKGGFTICLRDRKSYDIIRTNYNRVKAIHVPDLALAFDAKSFCKKHNIKLIEGNGNLFVRRTDSEKNETDEVLEKIPINRIEGDWPTMEKMSYKYARYLRWMHRLDRLYCNQKLKTRFTNFYYDRYIKPSYIEEGIKYLLPYSNIYSTRLHSAVLAYLLGKNVFIIDNSYGKCRGVYEDWINDQPNIKML